MLINKRLLLLIVVFSFIAHTSSASLSDFQIDFGIVGIDPDGFVYIKESTTNIPLKTKETGFRFGYIIKNANSTEFTGQLTVHFPSSPNKITGRATTGSLNKKGTILTYPLASHSNFWTNISWFDSGDPPGNWKYVIHINGKLYKEINFNVTQQ